MKEDVEEKMFAQRNVRKFFFLVRIFHFSFSWTRLSDCAVAGCWLLLVDLGAPLRYRTYTISNAGAWPSPRWSFRFTVAFFFVIFVLLGCAFFQLSSFRMVSEGEVDTKRLHFFHIIFEMFTSDAS